VNPRDDISTIDVEPRRAGASSVLMDLINGLLRVNPEERLSATDALAHRFYRGVPDIVDETLFGYAWSDTE